MMRSILLTTLFTLTALHAVVAQNSVPSTPFTSPKPVQTAEVEPRTDVTDEARRNTAVTLNYCRAALHRIRRAPSKRVLIEEQQRILNNLDLNRIDDPEVITLYRSILDEIGLVEISDRERIVIQEQFNRGMQRKLGTDFFVIGAQAATGQVGNVIQSGANSWWDYRSSQLKRETDLWQVEKTQFTTLMSRSSTFLDSFWKLSRKNQIPDRWLLRDQDLDQLGEALSEPDGERRLRMMARQERFMECYPPYWYYRARTQQQLGQTEEAEATYQKLTDIGSGHFRQDDMLASSMANLSLIQEGRNDPEAARTALRGFEFSSRNWEANLVCAWVLGRHGAYRDAEDLLLCNMDDGLETDQSSVALVSLYFHSNDKARLTRLLADKELVQRIPIPGLLLCAKLLGDDALPEDVQAYLASTLTAIPRRAGRMNSIAVAAAQNWKLTDAEVTIDDGDRSFRYAGHRATNAGMEVSFTPSLDSPSDGDVGNMLEMTVRYPATPAIRVVLAEEESGDEPQPETRGGGNRLPFLNNGLSNGLSNAIRQRETYRLFRIREIEVEGVRLSLRVPDEAAADIRVLKPEFSSEEPISRG